jgi:hypothetical protein
MMTAIEADAQVALALAGDVAQGENFGSRGGRFLHDNHPERMRYPRERKKRKRRWHDEGKVGATKGNKTNSQGGREPTAPEMKK